MRLGWRCAWTVELALRGVARLEVVAEGRVFIVVVLEHIYA